MNAGQAKARAREWIEVNRERWPDLRAAHLVGGVTALSDGEPFPTYKDVDLHLVVADGSEMLRSEGPFPAILEEEYGGLVIEAGVKPVAEYCSPETVLANPEIAHHLTLDPVLYDPDGLLAALQPAVRRKYACRRWVTARLTHEREGLRGAMERISMARALVGGSGEMNLLGYSFTYVAAALAVASLGPPAIGSRMPLRLHGHLVGHGRPELYDEYLRVMGVHDATREEVERFLAEGMVLFDRAVAVRRTPVPFGHKLHARMRAYFVQACRTVIDEGHHREALVWITPYLLSSGDVLLVDGPETERAGVRAAQERLLRALGMDTPEARDARWQRAATLQDACLTLADDIAARHAGIVD